jgi:hypothetical protein
MVFFVTLLAGIATLVKFVVIYCIGSSHVKGRFGWRSRFLKLDFAFSLIKREVEVAL